MPEQEKSNLDQLKALLEQDDVSSLNFEVPELQEFDAQSLFVDDGQVTKPKRFGKRSARHVQIQTPPISQPAKPEPEPVVEENYVVEEEPILVEEEQKVVDWTITKVEQFDLPSDAVLPDRGQQSMETGPLFSEKKRFLLSEYVKEESYLEQKSREGYHFVKKEGNTFYFTKEEPRVYYYALNFYKDEPSLAQKVAWRKEGWSVLFTAPSSNKKDAGWYFLRNEEQPGEYRKVLNNEEEKYHFFRKYSNACRSNLFFMFIIMACSLVFAFIQIWAQGYYIGIAACGATFLVALGFFVVYWRMLRVSKRQARLLRARLRLREREEVILDDSSWDEQKVQTEWDILDTKH